MKKAAFLIILLQFLLSATCEAKCFYFHGSENSEYVNPANWSPSYPGTNIGKNDTVIVQSDVNFTGFALKVSGVFEIVMGASCVGKGEGIIVLNNGKLINEGELRTKFIDNDGVIDNSVSAAWISDSCLNRRYGVINNLLASEMSVKRKMINEGKWNFGGAGILSGVLVNEGEIALSHSASLEVKGNYYAGINSKVLKSNQSSFLTEKKVAANTTTTVNYADLMENKAM